MTLLLSCWPCACRSPCWWLRTLGQWRFGWQAPSPGRRCSAACSEWGRHTVRAGQGRSGWMVLLRNMYGLAVSIVKHACLTCSSTHTSSLHILPYLRAHKNKLHLILSQADPHPTQALSHISPAAALAPAPSISGHPVPITDGLCSTLLQAGTLTSPKPSPHASPAAALAPAPLISGRPRARRRPPLLSSCRLRQTLLCPPGSPAALGRSCCQTWDTQIVREATVMEQSWGTVV